MNLKETLLSILKFFLPYRIGYSLFQSYVDIQMINSYIKKVDTNCRHLANIVTKKEYHLDGSGEISKKPLNLHELSIFSQNGEDGILLYIFSIIGTTSKTFIEFGVEDGKECNTANLSINHNWKGLLIDGSDKNVTEGLKFYASCCGDKKQNVIFAKHFVTAENINGIFLENGFYGEIDLLSIDLDGNDYYIWKAIDTVRPRVVVIEYNASFGVDRKATIDYDPNFVWNSTSYPELFYTGASLSLLERLATEKGYYLIGCDSCGINAFFVREDVGKNKLAKVTVKEAFYPHANRTVRFGLDGQEQAVRQLKLRDL